MRRSCSARNSTSSKAATTMCQPYPSAITWCAQFISISVTPALPKASHAVPPTATCSRSTSIEASAGRCGGNLLRSGRQRVIPSAWSSRRTLSDSRSACANDDCVAPHSTPSLGVGWCSMAVATDWRAMTSCPPEKNIGPSAVAVAGRLIGTLDATAGFELVVAAGCGVASSTSGGAAVARTRERTSAMLASTRCEA